MLVIAVAAPAAAASPPLSERLARQVLSAGDGWAAEGAGTTGGAAAAPENVFQVDTRDELAAAVAGTAPAIVIVRGTIRGNADPAGAAVSCAQFADPAYTLDAFLSAYDPAVWGRVAPSGPLEEARARSAANQSARVRVNVGSNKTIVGLGGARLNGVFLRLDGSSNVIIRNLTHEDSRDCFPVWSPTDGATGNWNAAYDNIWVRNSNHIWVDHNTFTDADNPDSAQPLHFGRPYQVHDGQVDITNGSNYVTVSYNRFTNHDKTMLIGSTNTPGADVGALKVTVHHNEFEGSVQRAPRVRFGQVDVYNNLYRVPVDDPYEYSFGVGVQSAIYAENNYVAFGADVPPDSFVFDWGGTVLTEKGTWARSGRSLPRPVNLLAAYNATHDPDIAPDAGWTPSLRAGHVLPAPAAALVVELCAGAGRIR
ncbi:pectate lyase [Asanoa ishikariensis]|uniref:pectate lyase family protein n=1 Tax=Asanoa ishikariensis TaxID=137265 RepID=UPI0031404CF1